MRGLLITLLAAVVLLTSSLAFAGRAPATTDALGAQDAVEAESESEEEASSEDDAARVQVAEALSPAMAIAARTSASGGLVSDGDHALPHFRPPIA